jgi:hypothetical protein
MTTAKKQNESYDDFDFHSHHNSKDQRNVATEKLNAVSIKSILQYAVVSVTPFIIMYLVWLHGISAGNTIAIKEHDIHLSNMKANNVELKELIKSVEVELKTFNKVVSAMDTRLQLVEGRIK